MTLLAAQTVRSQSSEFPIGSALPGDQDYPTVSLGANGGYLVWEDNRVDGKRGRGIAAVALNADFGSTGRVFKVNQQAVGDQGKPQAQLLGNGNTLIAWEVRRSSKPGVYARVLGADGGFLGGDIIISRPTWTTTAKRGVVWPGVFKDVWKERKFGFREKFVNIREQSGHISLGALPDGSAVVVYHSMCKTETNTWQLTTNYTTRGVRNDLLRPVRHYRDSMHDIYFQRLDGSGRKIGSEVLVNQSTDFNQRSPAMAVLSGGKFVVVWVSESSGSNLVENFRVSLRARMFDSAGQALSDEFSIAAGDDVVPANPSVAALPDGGFTVFWSQQEEAPSRRWDVHGAAFGPDGTATGGIFQVNSYTTGDQFAPKAASLGSHQFVVWTSTGQDGSREGVYGRLLAGGQLAGEEFQLNSTTISRQIHPTVGIDAAGRFLAVWSSFVGETGLDLFGASVQVSDGALPANP